MKYYAHSPQNEIPAQEYAAHILAVRERAVKYATEAGRYSVNDGGLLSNFSYLGATFHDLGKLDDENQLVLSGRKKGKHLPKHHQDAGTAHFLQETSFSPHTAALISSHHCGFPDFQDEINRGEDAFRDKKFMNEIDKLLETYEKIHDTLISSSLVSESSTPQSDRSVFLRMLLSCLADADHTDTAINYRKYPSNEKTIRLRPLERLKALNSHMENFKKNKERDHLRSEMYVACRDKEINENISSCDSPVGSGKTTAVMAHLLAQAEKRGLRRIFVILPFTNIIKQSVDTYRKYLILPGENPKDVVAELHHRADFESKEIRHLTALWRAPIIVTTAVAFFETLASTTPSTLRRLHELPGSAIFVDESHASLPAKLIPLTWQWMNIYAKEWGCYWVLASGSLNRFWEIPEISQNTNVVSVSEIVKDELRNKLFRYEANRIIYRSDLTPKGIQELIDWISKFPGPRLVIFNTVQSAAVVADEIRKQFGRESVEHLSTALTSNDRDKTLDRVKKRLASETDQDWTLVATSCVEAGVDISFRTGFRELGSLLSLLQTAGRVNREGLFDDAEIWTFLLAPDVMLKENPGMKDSAAILRNYIEQGKDITPALSTQSIADEIRLKGVSSQFRKLLELEDTQCFRSVENDFQVIDSNTRIVLVNEDDIKNLEHGSFDWQDLQRNSVQVANFKLKELQTPEIVPGIFKWNLEYDDFLGYMAGIIQQKKFSDQVLIL